MKTERHPLPKITSEAVALLYIAEVRKLSSIPSVAKGRNAILTVLAEFKEASPLEHAELVVDQFHALKRIEYSTLADHTFDYVHPVDAFLIGYHDHENNARYYEHSYYRNIDDL